MEDINNKFIIFNAQKNYKFLCKYLYDLQSHICYCHENNIINLYNKNIILGKIYELVKEINSDYNNFIINKIDYCKIILSKVIKFNFNDSDYEFIVLRDYIKNIYFIDYDDNLNKLLFPLDQNRNKILDLFNKYGSKNIYNIIEITLKLDVNIIFSRYTCIFLKFLNTCFIPLNFKILEDEFEKLNYEFSCYDPENECSEENFSDSDDCSIDS